MEYSTTITALPFSYLESISTLDESIVEMLLLKELEAFNKKIIVLDDDPTGVQTVHDIYVYTDWQKDTIRSAFQDEHNMFFILTNSRSFSVAATTQVHRDIAACIAEISQELGQDRKSVV